ncbi:isoprenylcysteine alpha-carbonyl methylesterase ICMEL1 [Phytophthora cinnamomi]|uniref:isoprenylcysteine alpha-carbonyl methylesterase ICMEL1 n=1 Tax=Phytophthora cinnamomi TaxID=4785 RepID=UPI00355A83DE|nr:isoprenylcysteine alpha-carbonyl methylesterase ICMEL1 [Phytophthora cinnamomi]
MSELPQLHPRRVALAVALLAYLRNTGLNLRQQHALLKQSEPRLPWAEHAQAALKYTSVGQLIASSEYLLCLVKPQLAARIGRLLLWTPRDCRANCRYGSHERHTLDVYGVQTPQAPAKPVLVFVHGGAWSFGHKWQYALVGEFLASQGFLVAVINYRTFPSGSVLDMVEDVENAVFWVAENCEALGGDSSKLFLSGHSSGGHVSALALVNSALRLAGNDPKSKEVANYVRAFIGLSAPYDISEHYVFESERVVGPLNGVHEISSMKPAMLGMGNFKKHSPTALVAEARNMAFSLPPFYLLHGEDDTVVPTSSSKKLAYNLKEVGQAAAYWEVSICTHEDMVFAVMGDGVDCRTDVVKMLKRIMTAPSGTEEAAATLLSLDSPVLTSRL